MGVSSPPAVMLTDPGLVRETPDRQHTHTLHFFLYNMQEELKEMCIKDLLFKSCTFVKMHAVDMWVE